MKVMSKDYKIDLSDANSYVLHPAEDDSPRTFTIPSNAEVPFELETLVTFVNERNKLTIEIEGGDTLTLAGSGATGTRTLLANGIATALKKSDTGWLVFGTGLC